MSSISFRLYIFTSPPGSFGKSQFATARIGAIQSISFKSNTPPGFRIRNIISSPPSFPSAIIPKSRSAINRVRICKTVQTAACTALGSFPDFHSGPEALRDDSPPTARNEYPFPQCCTEPHCPAGWRSGWRAAVHFHPRPH